MIYSYNEGQPLQWSDNIRMYQSYLNDIRATFHGNWDALPLSGAYDYRTRDAVRAFQIFTGQMASGELNESTQLLIKAKMNSANRSLLFWKPNIPVRVSDRKHTRPGGFAPVEKPTRPKRQEEVQAEAQPKKHHHSKTAKPITTETPPSSPPADMDPSVTVQVTPPAEKPTVPLQFTDPGFQGSDVDKFIDEYGSLFNDILGYIDSFIGGFCDMFDKSEPGKAVKWLTEKIKPLFEKMSRLGERLKNDFKRLFNVDTEKIMKMLESIKNKGTRLVERVKVNPQTIDKWATRGSKLAKKASIVSWAYQGLSLVYYLIMWATATADENEYYKGKALEAVEGLLSSLISTVVTKLLQIGGAAAAGAIAGTAVPGIGNIVGAIIGVVVAIADIIVVCITDKGLGDWALEGLKWVGGWAKTLGGVLVDAASSAINTVVSTYDSAVNLAASGFQAADDALTSVGNSISNWWNGK